jgi:hypothetical protein
MAINLEEFHASLFQDLLTTAHSNAEWTEDVFFEAFCGHLVDAGELETADRLAYAPSQGGMRVDGYGGDPLLYDGILSLIVSDFSQEPEIQTLTGSEMTADFKRLLTFLSKTLEEKFRNRLEEAHPVFGLADLIAARWKSISKVRLFLITNRRLSSRIDGKKAGEFVGVEVTYNVWDIERLHRYVASGSEREEIIIDLEKDFGRSLSILQAHQESVGYKSYLTVMPAPLLAAIYDRWHARLLEQNVRVFLQARGSVNKGIRNTIENEPSMFFAYNNGITATASEVQTRFDQNGISLVSIKNFQIVNGGQTTASIHAASRKKDVDLSSVFVQMKLSVISDSQAGAVVSRISEFANSQNRVNAADFFANHPFHIRMEEFSRRIFVPSQDGTFRETKWFYERARGQYQDARGLLTEAQRKKFDLEYPKAQVFSKTELAKFIGPWLGRPDSVSKGSQKCFADFAAYITPLWEKEPAVFGEVFYREAIAKAIIFRNAEEIVGQQPWYQGGGIRSRVVPYAIAKLEYDARMRGKFVDFEPVWKKQASPESMKEALAISSERVHQVIAGAPGEIPNPMEWAKQQACWNRVKSLDFEWPKKWFENLVGGEEIHLKQKTAMKEQRVLNGIEAQVAVVNSRPDLWLSAKRFAEERMLLSQSEVNILQVASDASHRPPSEKQCAWALAVLVKLRGEGFPEDL